MAELAEAIRPLKKERQDAKRISAALNAFGRYPKISKQ
jgi:hypothetical protein